MTQILRDGERRMPLLSWLGDLIQIYTLFCIMSRPDQQLRRNFSLPRFPGNKSRRLERTGVLQTHPTYRKRGSTKRSRFAQSKFAILTRKTGSTFGAVQIRYPNANFVWRTFVFSCQVLKTAGWFATAPILEIATGRKTLQVRLERA